MRRDKGVHEKYLAGSMEGTQRVWIMGSLLISGCQGPRIPDTAFRPLDTIQTTAPRVTPEQPKPTAPSLTEKTETAENAFDPIQEVRSLSAAELQKLDIKEQELPTALEALKHSIVHYPYKAFFVNDQYHRDGIRVKIKFHDLPEDRVKNVQQALKRGLERYASQIDTTLEFERDESRSNLLIGFHKNLSGQRPGSLAETTILGWTRYRNARGTYVRADKSLVMFDSDFMVPQESDFSDLPNGDAKDTQHTLYNLSIDVASSHEANHTDGFPDDHFPDPKSFMWEGHPIKKTLLQRGEATSSIQFITAPYFLSDGPNGSKYIAYIESYDQSRDPAYQALRLKHYIIRKFIAPDPGTPVDSMSFTEHSINWKTWQQIPD